MFPEPLIHACHEIVNQGVEQLKMPVGIVSHIYNDVYQIVTINREMGVLVNGAVFALSDTYCRDVYRADATLAITEIDGQPGMVRHPLYVNLPVEAYISAPIHHAGAVWGTVNFTSTELRKPFSTTEQKLVEGYAEQIGRFLDEIDTPNGPTGRK
jgi:GAF domain-containing protein